MQTAYHEAGHAIAALELGILFDTVSIVPGQGRLGSVKVEGDDGWFAPPGTDPDSPQNKKAFSKWAEEQAVIDYAGQAAVVALSGTGSMSAKSAAAQGAADDFAKARTGLSGDPRKI